MILARGPDSASADEPGIDVRAPLPRVVRRTPRPLARVGQLRQRREEPRCWPPRPFRFPSGLLPSGIGMAKPAIQQARDRAEVLWGATRPEWVTSAVSLERPSRDAGIGRAFCRQQPLGAISFAIIRAMMISGIFCEWVAQYDPLAIDFASLLVAPSWDHWCGTDAFGRDISLDQPQERLWKRHRDGDILRYGRWSGRAGDN
jgi:hypothetical protein